MAAWTGWRPGSGAGALAPSRAVGALEPAHGPPRASRRGRFPVALALGLATCTSGGREAVAPAAAPLLAIADAPAVEPPAFPPDAPAVEPPPPPAPPPAPPSPPSTEVPFEVVVDALIVESASNAALFGAPPAPSDPAAVGHAAEAVRAAVGAWLTRAFVDPATRFGPTGALGLLTPRAAALLAPGARPAFGETGLVVDGAATGPARVRLTVVVEGAAVSTVLAEVDARLTVTTIAGDAPVAVVGTLAFVPTAEGWRADAATLALEVPETPVADLPAVESEPAAAPAAASTPEAPAPSAAPTPPPPAPPPSPAAPTITIDAAA